MKRLLLILAVVVAQLLVGSTTRVAVSAELSGRPTVERERGGVGRLEAQLATPRHHAVQAARSRVRTRVQRTMSTASVASNTTTQLASLVGRRPTPEGSINAERFVALGLPDTRAP